MELFFSEEDGWKLFIDAEKLNSAPAIVQEYGGPHPAFLFDLEEPGYFQGMVQGYQVAMDFSRPLTKEFIREIHDAAVGPVYSISKMKRIPLGWRAEPTWFYFVARGCSSEGIAALRAKCEDPLYDLPEYGNLFKRLITRLPERVLRLEDFSSFPTSYIRFDPVPQELILAAVDRLIEIYQKEIGEAEGEEQKLDAIIRFVQNLNQAHPFFDGNIRTFGVLLLNRLLKEEGLLPCCFSNPNCLDGMSLEQLVPLVKQGQQNFLSLFKEA